MDINSFLNSRGFHTFEGCCNDNVEQLNDLINLTRGDNLNVLEIGFNAGHSSDTFLKNNKTLNIISFDIGRHDYVSHAKEYIDIVYPGRHTLIIGDSTKTIPTFIKNNKDKKYDFIFIDGGHEYETARADLENCYHLAHENTIVALDDTVFREGIINGYLYGPTKTWTEHVNQNKIIELCRREYTPQRGMSWGKYGN